MDAGRENEPASGPTLAPEPPGLGWRAGAAWLVFYLALAVAATWPLARDARDHVYGLGTPPLNVWAMGFVQHQLPRQPLALFDGNAFYPYEKTLAFSEHLFLPALLSWPVSGLSGNLVLGHNVAALLALALAGLGMHLLARELTGDGLAACSAGVLYAFHTWNVNELSRVQILSHQWFPFLLLALLRYFASPSRRGALWAGLAYLAQSLSCMYWALYAPFVAGVALAALQWRRGLGWRRLAPLGLGLAAALLATLPFAWPYVASARQLGFRRALPDSVGLGRWLDVLPGNHLYAGWLGTARVNQDAAHFVGFLALALALLGAWRGRFAARAVAGRGLWLAFALGGLVLSLGPEVRLGEHVLGPGPYRLLFDFVPGFRNVRYPERLALVCLLGLAPLVAAGLASLRARLWPAGGRRSASLALLAALLIFAEHFSAPLQLAPLPPGSSLPSVYAWLGRQPDVRVVAEVPAEHYLLERFDAAPMYHSTVHWKRTVQGFTGYFPPSTNFLRWRLFHFPAPKTLAFLARFGVDTVVVGPLSADARWPETPAVAAAQPAVSFAEGHRVLRLAATREPDFAEPAPPDPSWREVRREGWQARASTPGAERALDGRLETAWTTDQQQGRGDFFRVVFPRAVTVTRLRLAVAEPFVFATGLKLLGEQEQGDPLPLAFDERAAYDGLFALLLRRPREAALVLDLLEPRPVRGLRLRVTTSDAFAMPWELAELTVWERPDEERAPAVP